MDTYTALEQFPETECQTRLHKVRVQLGKVAPEADGLLVFSRLNIYYLTGTLASGVLWVPAQNTAQPVLLVRKGLARAQMESPVTQIFSFRSYSELPQYLPAGKLTVAAEMSGLTWAFSQMLISRTPDLTFVNGDAILTQARSVKTPWELAKLRTAGTLHRRAMEELLPARIHPGMDENTIARHVIDIYLSLGHGGLMRMNALGEEVFFGHVATGSSGNYPHYYNGPMGFRGIHPALPCLGSKTVWEKNMPLTVDMAFNFEAYITDKTQCFFAGTDSAMPPKARAAYDLCVAVQEEAAKNLKPGAIPAEIWAKVQNLVAGSGFENAFMGLNANQVPFLGHSIGLCIDESPVIASPFLNPVEEGMVFALEPKIGIEGYAMVGLENTYEVTSHGAKSLTSSHNNPIFLP